MKKLPLLQTTLACILFLVGCGGESASESPAADETNTGSGAEHAPTEAALTDIVVDPTFELRAAPEGQYQAGQVGHFEVRLQARGAYHVNQEFPMAIDLTGPTGMTLPTETLSNGDAVDFGEEEARFHIAVTPGAEGSQEIRAEVDFAVCTPEACMPDHRTLALTLDVAAP